MILSVGTAALAFANDGAKPHIVTQEEYEAIQRGEIKLDDGIPRIWNGGIENFCILTPEEYEAINNEKTTQFNEETLGIKIVELLK